MGKKDIVDSDLIKQLVLLFDEYKIAVIFGIIIIGFIIYNFNNSINDDNIYLTMTTIPERVTHPWFYKNLKKIMNLNGSYKVIINIPETFNATGEKYVIPKNILELQKGNLIINRLKEDYGPLTKLLGSLMNDNISDDAALLICDDDIQYYEDFVKLIYNQYKKDKSKIYTYCTPNIAGFKGFMVKKKIIKPILNIKRPKSCFRIDDNFIEEFIETNSIPVETVSYYGRENNNVNPEFCNFDVNIHYNHTPKWRELKIDNREPMIKKCKKDYHIMN